MKSQRSVLVGNVPSGVSRGTGKEVLQETDRGGNLFAGPSFPRNLRNIFTEVRKAAGLWHEWPQNALRHSFISYHVATYRNENETAQIAGTSPAMIYKHYRELVRPKESEEFFTLLPDSVALAEGTRVSDGRADAIHAARVAAGNRTGELNRKTGTSD